MSISKLYKILGLKQEDIEALSTKEDKKGKINKAFKAKAIFYHPDKSPNSTTLMQQINDARDKLIAYIDGTPIIEGMFPHPDFPPRYQAPHQESLYEMFTAQRSDFDIADEDIFSEAYYYAEGDTRGFSTVKRGNLLFKFASGGKSSFTLSCLLIDRTKRETHPLMTINTARHIGRFSQEMKFVGFSKFPIEDFIFAEEVSEKAADYTRGGESSPGEDFLSYLKLQISLDGIEHFENDQDFFISEEFQQSLKAVTDYNDKLKRELYGPIYEAIAALRDFLTKLQTQEIGVADIDEFATLQTNLLDVLRHPVRSQERFFSFVSDKLKKLVQDSIVEFSEEVKIKTQELITAIHYLKDSTNIDPMTQALVLIYKFFKENDVEYIRWISSINWDASSTKAENPGKQIGELAIHIGRAVKTEPPSQIILRLSQELIEVWLRSRQTAQAATSEQGFVSTQDAYEDALRELRQELNREDINDEIKEKTKKLIAQVLILKKNGEDIESLKNILLATKNLLTGQESPQMYQAHAAKFRGSASLGMQILGGLMMTLGAALLAAGIIMAAVLPASLPITATVAVGGAATLTAGTGFFAKGLQSGLHKSIIDLSEAKTQAHSI